QRFDDVDSSLVLAEAQARSRHEHVPASDELWVIGLGQQGLVFEQTLECRSRVAKPQLEASLEHSILEVWRVLELAELGLGVDVATVVEQVARRAQRVAGQVSQDVLALDQAVEICLRRNGVLIDEPHEASQLTGAAA